MNNGDLERLLKGLPPEPMVMVDMTGPDGTVNRVPLSVATFQVLQSIDVSLGDIRRLLEAREVAE
jgi:hypothetical protein